MSVDWVEHHAGLQFLAGLMVLNELTNVSSWAFSEVVMEEYLEVLAALLAFEPLV